MCIIAIWLICMPAYLLGYDLQSQKTSEIIYRLDLNLSPYNHGAVQIKRMYYGNTPTSCLINATYLF